MFVCLSFQIAKKLYLKFEVLSFPCSVSADDHGMSYKNTYKKKKNLQKCSVDSSAEKYFQYRKVFSSQHYSLKKTYIPYLLYLCASYRNQVLFSILEKKKKKAIAVYTYVK